MHVPSHETDHLFRTVSFGALDCRLLWLGDLFRDLAQTSNNDTCIDYVHLSTPNRQRGCLLLQWFIGLMHEATVSCNPPYIIDIQWCSDPELQFGIYLMLTMNKLGN